MKPVGKLSKISGQVGVPIIYQTNTPVPGPTGAQGPRGDPGMDGMPGADGPSKDEIIAGLKADNEFLQSLVEKKKWEFHIQRDELGLITSIEAMAKFEENN